MISMLTAMPTPTPTSNSRIRSANIGSLEVRMKIAVVAIATPSSRIHDSRAPTNPTSRASAKDQILTSKNCRITKARPMPTADETTVCTPRDSERCTVACTVNKAVQGAMNATSLSSTKTERAHAAVPAMTPLMANSISEVVSGWRNRWSILAPIEGCSSSPEASSASEDLELFWFGCMSLPQFELATWFHQRGECWIFGVSLWKSNNTIEHRINSLRVVAIDQQLKQYSGYFQGSVFRRLAMKRNIRARLDSSCSLACCFLASAASIS